MLDDLTKEIKAQLYDRVKSPLFGAFSLSWVAWNYRALLSVLSDLKFNEKLAYLDNLYPSRWDWAVACLLYPLITAVLLLLLYPHPARWIYGYWAKQQKELKKVQQKIEDDTPLTQEEARELRKKSLAQAIEYESQLSELRQQNKELRELLRNAAKGTLEPLNIAEIQLEDGDAWSKNNSARNTLDTLSQTEQVTNKILNSIARIGRGSTDDVAALAHVETRETKGNLLGLAGDGMVTRIANEKWEITEKGKLAAAKHPSYWGPQVHEARIADSGKLQAEVKIQTAVTESAIEQNKEILTGTSSPETTSDILPNQATAAAPPKNAPIRNAARDAIIRLGEASTEDIARLTNQPASLIHEELLQLAMNGIVRREKGIWCLTERVKLFMPG